MDSIIGGLSNLRVDTVLSAVDKYVPGAQTKIKNVVDKAKAYVNNVSELEMKVLEATNHEPWGPHGTVMQEITNSSFNSEGFYQIMSVCDQRLSEGPDNWRLVYKTLLLLEYMCKHGPLSVVEALSSYSRLSQLEKLRDRFEYKDPAGRDQGINVRQRAGALATLVQDNDKLKEERDKAAKNKSKYTGVSSSSGRYGGFSGGSSNDYQSSAYSSYSPRDYGSSGSSNTSSSTTTATYQRSSSGGVGGSSSSSSAAAPPADKSDPVEATRQRIARLKAEGVIGADAAVEGGSGDVVGPGLESPTAMKRQPKKLSEIKIDPNISAAFSKSGLAPPPGSSSRTKSTSSSGAGSTAAAASNPIDLLGDLEVPAPAAPAAASSSAVDEWDGFAGAAPAASALKGAGDEWSAFNSAPTAGGVGKAAAASAHQKGPIDVNSLFGTLPSTTPAAARGKAPLALDDFSMPPAVQPAAVQATAAAKPADPFGPFVTPVAASQPPAAANTSSGFTQDPFAAVASDPLAGSGFSRAPAAPGLTASAGDPFAASGVVHMVPQAIKGTTAAAAAGPKLGPETAKAKDPFADLALI